MQACLKQLRQLQLRLDSFSEQFHQHSYLWVLKMGRLTSHSAAAISSVMDPWGEQKQNRL